VTASRSLARRGEEERARRRRGTTGHGGGLVPSGKRQGRGGVYGGPGGPCHPPAALGGRGPRCHGRRARFPRPYSNFLVFRGDRPAPLWCPARIPRIWALGKSAPCLGCHSDGLPPPLSSPAVGDPGLHLVPGLFSLVTPL
jgi:hypothetical protein